MYYSGAVSATSAWPVSGVGIAMLILFAFMLLYLFVHKLRAVIEDFIQQFGKITPIQLAELNKSLRCVLTLIAFRYLAQSFVFCSFR